MLNQGGRVADGIVEAERQFGEKFTIHANGVDEIGIGNAAIVLAQLQEVCQAVKFGCGVAAGQQVGLEQHRSIGCEQILFCGIGKRRLVKRGGRYAKEYTDQSS